MNRPNTTFANAAEQRAYARLVAEKYEQEFGDRLTLDQILDSDHPFEVMVEYDDAHRLVAGIKLAPLAGSFTEVCVGEQKLQEIFDDTPLGDVVEISKTVNIGNMIHTSRLLVRAYKWLREHSPYGFVAFGPQRTMNLYRWALSTSWNKPWNVQTFAIDDPQYPVPDHLNLGLLWAQPKVRGCYMESPFSI